MSATRNRDYSFSDAFFFFSFSGSLLLFPIVVLGTFFLLVFCPVDALADDLSCLSGGYVSWWDAGNGWPYAYDAVKTRTLTGNNGISENYSNGTLNGDRAFSFDVFGNNCSASSFNSFAVGVVKFPSSPSFTPGDYYVSTPATIVFSHKSGRTYVFDTYSTANTDVFKADSYLCLKDSSGEWHTVHPASGYFSVDYSFDEIYFYTYLPKGYSFVGTDDRAWGFTSLPKFFKVTQVTNQDIVNQTESLKDTSGADNSFSDVVSSNSQSDFDTRLGAVSQVVDISGQLFTAVLGGNEGNGIPFSGYSVKLPVGGTLSVPASTVDIWSMFPDAETPIRTALTLILVILWVHGVYRWYESLVSPEDAE